MTAVPTTRRTELGGRRQATGGTRRVATHTRYRFAGDLHCECGEPDCRGSIPEHAGTFREIGQIVVVPGHYSGSGTVIRAADDFFVVVSN